MKATDLRRQKKYLIALEVKHSILALVAGILVLLCTLGAIIIRLKTYNRMDEDPMHHFTILSNLLSFFGAAFMIPFAVEGIRKKHFTLPRFVILFQFAGATCVTITMLTSLALIWPVQGVEAVTGTNFWLHLISPFCTLVLFQCVETGIALTRREALFALIPFWLYMAVYYIMVVVIGKENGGWSDIYMTQAFFPVWVSMLLFLVIGFAVSAALRIIQNRRAEQTWRIIAGLWSEDLEPPELLIEAFGLGRYIGSKCADRELTVPLGIFSVMAERCNISLSKLVKAYVKGALDSAEEKQSH